MRTRSKLENAHLETHLRFVRATYCTTRHLAPRSGHELCRAVGGPTRTCSAHAHNVPSAQAAPASTALPELRSMHMSPAPQSEDDSQASTSM